jgi:mRNA interferase RelE/StbE
LKKTYEIRATPKFSKGIKTLEQKTQSKIIQEISILKTNPYAGKPLHGDWKGVYSLRIGIYRVLYLIKENQIHLLLVGHRKHVYE